MLLNEILKRKLCITLVETLIAVLVIGIGIIVILQVVIFNIGLIDRLKNKTIATFLAKEGIELFISYRDSNLQRGIDRDCLGLDSNFNCIKKFGDIEYLQIALNWSGGDDMFLNGNNSFFYVRPTNGSFTDNILYYHTGIIDGHIVGFYSYNSGISGNRTNFSRFLHLTGVYLQGDGKVISKDKLIKVESIILWKHGRKTGKVFLETFVGDIK